MIAQCLKGFAALALALAAAGCGNTMRVSIGDDEGVKLADLDMSGAAPTKLALASSDRIVVSEGPALDIAVSGDPEAVEALRFTIEDGRLGVMRAPDSRANGVATVAVTLPAPREFDLLGSGIIEAPAMASDATVNIAGSGQVAVAKVAASKMAVNVVGSGTLNAAGAAERLEFNVAGSGKLAGRDLKVETANVSIVGSGSGEFSSDGRVQANIGGSGEVTVYGRADCQISAIGSGKLRCVNGATTRAAAGASPAPPSAPKAPRAPEPPTPAN